MTFIKWPRAVIALLLCFCINIPAVAQSVAAQQASLAASEKQLEALIVEQQQIETAIADTQTELSQLNNQPSAEKDELDAAKKLLDEATNLHRRDPTADNKAKMSNAAFKHALAERKFKKANTQLVETELKRDELTEQLAATDQQITLLKQRIDRQRKAIERQIALQASKAKQQAIEQRKAQAEIERLRAELAKQKQPPLPDTKTKVAAVAAPAIVAPTEKGAEPVKTAANSTVVPKSPEEPKTPTAPGGSKTPAAPEGSKTPATQEEPKTPAAPEGPKTPAAPEGPKTPGAPKAPNAVKKVTSTANNGTENILPEGKGIFLLTTKEQVQAEEKRLAKLQTKAGKRRSRYNKILNIKTVRPNGSISRPKSTELRALGNNQYKAKVKIKNSQVVFVVGFDSWRQSINRKPGGTNFVFIYDASNKDEPRLVYYDQSLSSK